MYIFGVLSGILISSVLLLIINKIISNNSFSFVELNQKPNLLNVSVSSKECFSLPEPQSKSKLINLNTADLAELNTLPGIGEVKARNIILWRDKYGDFKDISELMYVSGISDNIFQGLCHLISAP